MSRKAGGIVVVGKPRNVKVPDLDRELKRLNRVPPPEFSLLEMHSIVAFIGRRGSGKTYAAIQLAMMMKREGAINRVYVISPTVNSNHIFELLELKDEDKYHEPNESYAALDDIVSKIQQDVDDWQKEMVYAMAYSAWKANEKDVDVRQRELLEREDYRKPDPESKRPNVLLILDDMSHSQLFSSSRVNPFVSFLLRHRHICEIGVTVFLALQNFKGLSRSLRLNTCQFAIWRTADVTELKALYDEIASVCSWQDFLALFQYATEEPHSFLFVNLNAGSDPRDIFKKNFDTPIWNGHPSTLADIEVRHAGASERST